jgi:hypothetical protein
MNWKEGRKVDVRCSHLTDHADHGDHGDEDGDDGRRRRTATTDGDGDSKVEVVVEGNISEQVKQNSRPSSR